MQYRTDPKTGNQLSVLGFGCMRLPGSLGRVDIAKTEKLFLEAIDKGVNYFDTAYLYPGSEEAVGEIFERNSLRDKAYIATKLPQMLCKTTEDLDRFFDIQKRRLRMEYVDYYFIHNLASFEAWQRLCGLGIEQWIAAKKQSGEIRQLGFSFHGPQGDFAKLLDAYDWDFCQIQYNYINTNYQAGEKGLKQAAENGLPVFIMEPLLGGKLATGLPPKAQDIFKQANPDLTPAGWALRWLWNQPEVTLLLSGMNEPAQLEENCRLADESAPGMLTDGERKAVDEVVTAFNESYKVGCTGCNYCMPCPKGINIPALFSAYNSSYSIGWLTGMQQYVISTAGMSDAPRFATDCVGCGKCEGHCPQAIEIRGELVRVRKRLQPFFLPGVLRLATKMR